MTETQLLLLERHAKEHNDEDMLWLIKQAKTLAWVKQAISVCNEEDITPKELSALL